MCWDNRQRYYRALAAPNATVVFCWAHRALLIVSTPGLMTVLVAMLCWIILGLSSVLMKWKRSVHFHKKCLSYLFPEINQQKFRTIQGKIHMDTQILLFVNLRSGSYSKQGREDTPSRNGFGQKKNCFWKEGWSKGSKWKANWNRPIRSL